HTRSKRDWSSDVCSSDLELGGLVGDVQISPVPREVLVPELPAGNARLGAWLGELRGSKVTIRVPQRGDKKALLSNAHTNATQARSEERRVGNKKQRQQAA